MSELMKSERVIEGNLCNLFALMMILCDSDTKNQRKSSAEYTEL